MVNLTWVMLAIAVAGALLVLGPWVAVFPYPLSRDPNNWAAFGTYVGGTLSPLLALLALVALLRTISQQQAQIEQLKKQAAKSDLLKVVEKLEQDFERPLRAHSILVDITGTAYKFTALDAVSKVAFPGWEQAMINQEDVLKALEDKGELPTDHQSIHTLEVFSIAAGHLNQLRLYVQKHDEVAGNNALTKYYQRKYKLAYDRFVNRKFLQEVWQPNTLAQTE